MFFIYPLILLAAGFLAKDPDHWHQQTMFGEIGIAIWLSIHMWKKVHKIPAITFAFFSVYSIYCQYRFNPVNAATEYDTNFYRIFFDAETARSVFILFCITIPYIFAKTEDLKSWFWGWKFFSIVNCFYMFYSFFTKHAAVGLIGADSVDGSFLALMLPFFWGEWIAFGIMLAALFLSFSSTVYGLLILEAAIFLIYKRQKIILAGLLLLTPIVGKLYLGSQLTQDNGRLALLKVACGIFLECKTKFWGFGTSFYLVIIPALQSNTRDKFGFAHNEPFQVLFEQGIIGLFLLSLLYFTMVYKTTRNLSKNASKTGPLALSVIAAGFQSFLQPCFRYFIFSLFLVFLARLCFEYEENFN